MLSLFIIYVLSLYVLSLRSNDSHFHSIFNTWAQFEHNLSTITFSVSLSKFVNLFICDQFNVCLYFSLYYRGCTSGRTNHLLWTAPEVEPDGGPDGVEDPKGEGPKGEAVSRDNFLMAFRLDFDLVEVEGRRAKDRKGRRCELL